MIRKVDCASLRVFKNDSMRMHWKCLLAHAIVLLGGQVDVFVADSPPVAPKDDAESSDRELARLIAEMFKGTGIDENMVVAFPDGNQAKKAARQWEFSDVPGKIQILDAKGKKAKSTRGSGGEHECPAQLASLDAARRAPASDLTASPTTGGFGGKKSTDDEAAAAVSASAVPEGTEVLIVVAPTEKQLKVSERAWASLVGIRGKGAAGGEHHARSAAKIGSHTINRLLDT